MAPIYELKNGKFQVSYHELKNHKRIRRKFETLQKAKEFELKIKQEFGNREALKASKRKNYKVVALMQYHLESCKETKVQERKNTFKSFMEYFQDLEIYQVDKQSLRGWFELIRTTNNYTEKTLSHIKAQVNHFFKFLVENSILEINPLDTIKFKQNIPPKKEKVIFSSDELKSVLSLIRGISPEIFYSYFYALAHTGARRNEVALLKWQDVNLPANILTFRNTKNGTNRCIKLSFGLRELLEGLPRTSEYVFKGKNHSHISGAHLYRFFQRFRRAYPEIKPFACHDLRHSFAFNFLKMGGNMYALKAILGHKGIQMTIDLYGNFKSIHVENPSPYDF